MTIEEIAVSNILNFLNPRNYEVFKKHLLTAFIDKLPVEFETYDIDFNNKKLHYSNILL